ncbi:MAG TPA: YHS domain-containing protein [Gemmataceae bacterium]|jgi:hypothetical protein|nr:YHS domain-containing protein [Gemmataceae bacterium]
MKYFIVLGVLLAVMMPCAPVTAADDDEEVSAKQALQALNDYIGEWNGSGAPEKPRPDPKEGWRETINWRWGFKGDDAWLVVKIKNGQYFKRGTLRYLTDKKRYQLTLITTAAKKQVFEGTLEDDVLALERLDPDKKETQRLKMNLAGDGARFVYRYEHRPRGSTLFYKDYQVGCSKEGESLTAKEKKIECVVSGGLGKIPVSYKGVTYYVCCSGCKDAFEENPAKYVKEYEAKHGKN